MNNYFDYNGYLHDKKCIDFEPSSNNPLIYTGILKVLTGYELYYRDSFWKRNYHHYKILNSWGLFRTMGNGNMEVTSLDEVIGAVLLGFLTHEHFEDNWNWYPKKGTSKIRIFQALVYCAGKHRNFFKENYVSDLEDIAYWVPWHIQYWILKKGNKRAKFHQLLAFYVYILSVFIKSNKKHGNVSQKNIAWAILKDLNNPLHKLINYKNNLRKYFGSEHIINNLDQLSRV